MPQFDSQTIEQVRDAVDFVALVGEHTELQKSGSEFVGRCPFHDDSSPSFSINPDSKVFHCFGCGAGGDVFAFYMKTQNTNFHHAVLELAERYGVPIADSSSASSPSSRGPSSRRILQLLAHSADYYQRTLFDSKEAETARSYLADRGFSEDILRRFGIGYAPDAWNKLSSPALAAGYSRVELLQSGLARENKDGGLYDVFRARITFPITDERDQVRAFGARAIDPDAKAKYINSADSIVFKKGRLFFGRSQFRPARELVLCEGYTDLLAFHEAGFSNSLSLMGTAMTREQASAAAGLCDDVVLVFDHDEPGLAAARRAGELLRSCGVARVRVSTGEKHSDPASIFQSQGSAGLAAVLRETATFFEIDVDTAIAQADLVSIHGRDRLLHDLLPIFSSEPAGPIMESKLFAVAQAIDLPIDVLRQAFSDRNVSLE